MTLIVHGRFDQAKFGFVHLPKTAGTSLRNWIALECERQNIPNYSVGTHSTLPELRLDAGYDSVAVIRNPWERLLSFYSHMQSIATREVSSRAIDLVGPNLPNPDIEFKDWVRNVHLYYFTNHVAKVGNWAAHNQREVLWYTPVTPMTIWLPQDPTILIRYEKIDEGFGKLQEMMRSTEPLPHHNVHSKGRKHYTELYDDVSKKIVEKYFALDIDRWGYKFGD